MADVIDEAQALTEQALAVALAYTRCAAKDPEPNGICFNCEEEVGEGMRFCDQDCRDDWQRRRRYARGAG